MYYRRWTRMHFLPALRYFHKYGVLDADYDFMKPLVYQELPHEVEEKWKPKKRTKLDNLDEKLMKNLFMKYPDLKFESLDRARAPKLRQTNTFSYAYSFLSEQKRLIDRGYSIEKSFELAEQKFQDKINRKMDQTLLSKGLAIGNRARSFLNVYQQQMEYESRLKTERTQRELKKYEEKLANLKDKIEKEPSEEEIYARMLYKIEQAELFPENKPEKLLPDAKPWQNREEFVGEFQTNVKSVFQQFYQSAASKDRLEGLKDEQIINQIMEAPGKIKRRLDSLLKKMKKYGVKLKTNGQVDYSAVTNPHIKKLFMENSEVKLALMTAELDFELPHREHMREQARKYAQKLKELEEEQKMENLSQEEKDIIYKNKKIAYLPYQSSALREEPATYKAFETYEERLLRIEIKWLRNKLAEWTEGVDATTREERQNALKTAIDSMRRLKYRIEQKNLEAAQNLNQEQNIIFSEHKQLGKDIMADSKIQHQELLHYLKKKVQERRVSTYEQINDDKINKLIERVKIQQDPRPEGFRRVDKRE